MCLAVAPDKQTGNTPFFRTWRQAASTPLRMLSFCAFSHVPVLAGLFTRDLASGAAPDIHACLVPLRCGLLALLALNLVTLMVSVPGRVFGADTFSLATASISTLLVWPLLTVAIPMLLLIAPDKGRVISL